MSTGYQPIFLYIFFASCFYSSLTFIKVNISSIIITNETLLRGNEENQIQKLKKVFRKPLLKEKKYKC